MDYEVAMTKVNQEVENLRKEILSISPYSLVQISAIDHYTRVIIESSIETVEYILTLDKEDIKRFNIDMEVMNLFTTKYDMYNVNKLFN